ncbi:MAG: hypothetical protein C4536_10590 [Actinobacteria bacterium]|nr:MAG: hypothetical protein C4536_10590 [Actinomycetota bacterium]
MDLTRLKKYLRTIQRTNVLALQVFKSPAALRDERRPVRDGIIDTRRPDVDKTPIRMATVPEYPCSKLRH